MARRPSAALAACSFGCGVVFKLTPPTAPDAAWTYSVLHSFTGGSEGSGPTGKLTFDPAGALYGTSGSAGNLKRRQFEM